MKRAPSHFWDIEPPSLRKDGRNSKWDIPPDWHEEMEVEQINHGQELLNELLELYFESPDMSARRLCKCAWHAYSCGIEEFKPFSYYVENSSEQTGHPSRKVEAALDLKNEEAKLYTLAKMPLTSRSGDRELKTMLVNPIHESIWNEVQSTPELLEDWKKNIHEHWLPVYENHVHVRDKSPEDRARTLAMAIYMDATEFQKRDSILVCSVHLINSTRRHLAFAVRKSSLCSCGCKGWCTLYNLYVYLYWCLCSLRDGVMPDSRHDGSPFNDTDAYRISFADQFIKFMAVVIDICVDWAEIALRWGFPTWSSMRPCPFCNSSLEMLRSRSMEWQERTTRDYIEDCRKCEIWIVVESEDLLRQIKFSLVPSDEQKGRILDRNISNPDGPDLRKGDRLEPFRGRPDVYAQLVLPEGGTLILLFWRTHKPITIHHRHPLLGNDLGVGLEHFSIDVLHTLHLGVYHVWLNFAMWHLIRYDVWDTGATIIGRKVRLSLHCFMSELLHWYPLYEAELTPHVRRGMTRVQQLTAAMIGEDSDGKFKTKAAESRHLLPFVVRCARLYSPKLKDRCAGEIDVDALIDSGQALIEYMDVLSSNPRQLSTDAIMRLINLTHRHLEMAERAQIQEKAKHHLFLHLTYRIATLGNPRFYSCYHDESINKVLARIAASCYRHTFERRLFSKHAYLENHLRTHDIPAWL